MVTIPESVAQAIPKLFDIHKCWLIVNLAAELNYAVISVRRFLAEFGYYSSYTHNGKYYTLRSIPQFHHDGIWLYQDIGFSRRRSLTETLIHLASRSPAGLTAEELIEKSVYLNREWHLGAIKLFVAIRYANLPSQTWVS